MDTNTHKGCGNRGKGRKPGAKNKRTQNLLQKLDEIDAFLESKGKGLKECANEDPKWYAENFIKPRIPKNLDVNLDGKLEISWQK